MTDAGAGRRRVRAGHGDRERAVRSLSDHFAEGRLDPEEFDRRVTAAYAAVYVDELQLLFGDLPGFGAAFAGDVVDGDPAGPAAGGGSARRPGPVPAYRADTRWAPPPTSHSRYRPPGPGPTPSPAVARAVLTVAVVVLVGLLVLVTRGMVILPLIFVALPFVLGGGRRRRRLR